MNRGTEEPTTGNQETKKKYKELKIMERIQIKEKLEISKDLGISPTL